MEGVSKVLIPAIGALAGTPFADLLFTFAEAKVLKTPRGFLHEAGLCTAVNLSDLENVLGVCVDNRERSTIQFIYEISFVDDGVWPIFSTADCLAKNVRKAIEILDRICSSFGFVVNYKKGKTMVLMRFFGKGSKSARAQFFAEQSGKIVFDGWLGFEKKIVKTLLSAEVYKHMGSQSDVSSAMMPEIVARTNSMKGAYASIKTKIIRNDRIPVQNRLSVVVIYLITKGFFQAGTWRNLNIAKTKRVHNSLMAVFRGVLRVDCPNCEHKTDDEVIEALACLSSMSTVVLLRINLFVRLLVKKNWTLLAVAASASKAHGSWLSAVHSNLLALATVENKLEELRGAPLAVWANAFAHNHKDFLRVLHIAIGNKDVNRVAFWWPRAKSNAVQHNALDGHPAPALQEYECDKCSYKCCSPQALS